MTKKDTDLSKTIQLRLYLRPNAYYFCYQIYIYMTNTLWNKALNAILDTFLKIVRKVRSIKSTLILTHACKTQQRINNTFFKIRFPNSQLLEIVFFKELDNVDIVVRDRFKNLVYELTTPTVPTLHILIDIQGQSPGLYSVHIHNPVIDEITFVVIPEHLSSIHNPITRFNRWLVIMS